MGRCPRAHHQPPEWGPRPSTGFPPGRRPAATGWTDTSNGQAAACIREDSSFAGLSPAPWSHGSHAPMGDEKSHSKPWLPWPKLHLSSGFRWLRSHIVLSLDQSLERDIRDLSPRAKPLGILLWTQSHIERRPIPAHLPPCLPNPGQAPNPSTVCPLFITRQPL